MAVDGKARGVPLGALPLETLGDVRRAMSKVANEMRTEDISRDLGNALIFAYSQLAGMLKDSRDSRFKKQFAVIWKEREEAAGRTATPSPEH